MLKQAKLNLQTNEETYAKVGKELIRYTIFAGGCYMAYRFGCAVGIDAVHTTVLKGDPKLMEQMASIWKSLGIWK